MKFVLDDMIRIEPNQMILVNTYFRIKNELINLPFLCWRTCLKQVMLLCFALLCGISYMNF